MRIALCAFALTLLGSTFASAEDKPAEAKQSVDAFFAEKMGVAVDKKIDPEALEEGVPLGLVEIIKKRYPQANSQGPLLAEYQKCAVDFEAKWKTFSERRALTDEAVKKAEELKAGKKLKEALAALDAVVTNAEPPPVDHLGRPKPVKRDFLEVRDAELAAVTAAAALAVELRMMERMPQARADLMARRDVSTRVATERLGYLAQHCGKNKRKAMGRFNGFASGQKNEALKAVQSVLGYCQRASNSGASMAKGFFRSLGSYGVEVVLVGSKPQVKKGQWVLMGLEPTKASKKKISYKKKDTWKEAFNCRPTEQIVGIDPVTGKFQYKYKCETRTKKSLVTLTAKLAKSAKLKKNKRGKYDRVWIIGQLKKPGPKWKLSKARVIELSEGENLKFLEPGNR